jgi:RimJ/RimL family protein N-acetyltransferase
VDTRGSRSGFAASTSTRAPSSLDPARLPPELLTERLYLRQWRDEDAEPLAAIYAEPAFLEHMPSLDLEGTKAQIERFHRQWTDEGFSHWAVEDRPSGRLIGRIGLMRHRDWTLGGAPVEVGWSLHPEFWGRGLAGEGGRASVEVWRERLPGEPQLISITSPANARSRRVMEKLGLSLRGETNWHGHDVVWYAVDR